MHTYIHYPLADWNSQSEEPLDVGGDGEGHLAVVQGADGVLPTALGILNLEKTFQYQSHGLESILLRRSTKKNVFIG